MWPRPSPMDCTLHPRVQGAGCRVPCRIALTAAAAAGPTKHKQATRAGVERIRTSTSSVQLKSLLQSKKKLELEQLVTIHAQTARLLQQKPNSSEHHALVSILHQAQGQVLSKITRCNARQLTSLLEALYRTTCVTPVHLLVQSVVREVGRPSLLAALNPTSLASLATALSKNTQRLLCSQAAADPQGTTHLEQLLSRSWESLAARAHELAPKMSGQVACSVLASLARARHYDATIIDALLQRLSPPGTPAPAAPAESAAQGTSSTEESMGFHRQQADTISLAAVSGAVWACATFMHPHTGVQQLAHEQLRLLHNQLSTGQSNTQAQGTSGGVTTITGQQQQQLQHRHAQVSKIGAAIGQGQAGSSSAALIATDVANLAWSAGILGGKHSMPLVRLCVLCMLCPVESPSHAAAAADVQAYSSSDAAEPACSSGPSSGNSHTPTLLWQHLQPAAAAQMMQALLLAAMHDSCPVSLVGVHQLLATWGIHLDTCEAFVASCHASWCSCAAKSRPSATQQQVCRALRKLGAQPQMEQLIEGGLFSVDIVVAWAGQQIVVEVDGPPHFCASPASAAQQPLGATEARHALLRACGWRVLPIHTNVWHALQSDASQSQLAGIAAADDSQSRMSVGVSPDALQWLKHQLDHHTTSC